MRTPYAVFRFALSVKIYEKFWQINVQTNVTSFDWILKVYRCKGEMFYMRVFCVSSIFTIYIVINCVYLADYCEFEGEIKNHIYRELLVRLKQGTDGSSNWCQKKFIGSMCSWFEFDFSLRTPLACRACFVLTRFKAENLTLSILLNKCSKEHIIHDYRNNIWAKVLQSETWYRV